MSQLEKFGNVRKQVKLSPKASKQLLRDTLEDELNKLYIEIGYMQDIINSLEASEFKNLVVGKHPVRYYIACLRMSHLAMKNQYRVLDNIIGMI